MAVCASSLDLFRRQYLQLVELEHLAWPSPQQLRMPDTQAWIFNRMFNGELMQYLPPNRYQLRVLKRLMARIERAIIDPDEDVGPLLCIPMLQQLRRLSNYHAWDVHVFESCATNTHALSCSCRKFQIISCLDFLSCSRPNCLPSRNQRSKNPT